MKINSRFLGMFSALLVIAIMISSVSAASDLVKGDLADEEFSIYVPSSSDFVKDATTNITLGDMAMNMHIFENQGDNQNDVSSIIYVNDGSSDKSMISSAIKDLEKEGSIIDENKNYFVVEHQKTGDFFNLDFLNGFDNLWGIGDIFSSNGDVNIETNDSSVSVSSNGINIEDNDNTTVSFSDKGLKVSDSNGENVVISSDGVKVSGEATEGSDNLTVDGNVSIDGDMVSNFNDGDYSVCIKSKNNDQIIILTGDNLDILKEMAATASFTEE